MSCPWTYNNTLHGHPLVRLTIATISAERSRTLGPVRSDLVTETVGKHLPKEGRALVILVLTSAEQVYASALAVARALSLYSKKTVVKGKEKSGLAVRVVVRAAGGNADDAAWAVDYAKLGVAAVGANMCWRSLSS